MMGELDEGRRAFDRGSAREVQNLNPRRNAPERCKWRRLIDVRGGISSQANPCGGCKDVTLWVNEELRNVL